MQMGEREKGMESVVEFVQELTWVGALAAYGCVVMAMCIGVLLTYGRRP
jgi:hypothetical protein